MQSQILGNSTPPWRQTARPNGIGDEQTQNEQLAFGFRDDAFDGEGETCELHAYGRRQNTSGEEIWRTDSKEELEPPKRISRLACMVLTRYYTSTKELLRTELEIQSRHIIKALREVIVTYPGVDLASKYVTIREPPMCLFHYRLELQEYAQSSNNAQLKSHMRLCLQYMETAILKTINIHQLRSGELEHRHLWVLFKPDCLILQKEGTSDEPLSRFRSISGQKNYKGEVESWEIVFVFTACKGSRIGLWSSCMSIPHYDGCKPVCDLPIVPLEYLPDSQRIQHDALERGRKYLSLCGTNYCFYDGLALLCGITSPNTHETFSTHVKHRIILDSEAFTRAVTGYYEFVPGTKSYESATEAISNLSDDEIMICHSCLQGYSLELKRWGHFKVTDITEVTYNDNAFDALVLAEDKKKLMSSLLARQNGHHEDEFDDLISGKGKGLIFLLHGPPGLGKTYTAECMADHTRRPLLKVQSNELDDRAEQRLSELFSLAARWAGVLLLDEADVFMQDRSLQTLERNRLVTMLLRILEHNTAILFLTTNRIETIDPAFQSRIHLSIAYPPLSAAARRELWTTFILRAATNRRQQPPEWLTEDFLEHIVNRKQVNGREVKNVVRIGLALARSSGRDLQRGDLLQGLDALKRFDEEFIKGRSEESKIDKIW